MGRAIVSGIVNGGIYGLIALGIVLVYRGSRVLNLAAIEIGAFALYVTSTLVVRDVPWALAGLVGVAAAAAIGFAFERIVVARMVDAGRLSVAVATIGHGAFLIAAEVKIWKPAPRFVPSPFKGLGPEILGQNVSPLEIVSLCIVVALGIGLTSFLRRTDFGLGVLAAAQDPIATRLVGVPLWKVSAFTWTVAGGLSGIAMLLVEPSIGGFAPGTLAASLFVPALAAALVGGLDNPSGAFAGGLVMGLIDQVVRYWFLGLPVPGSSTIVIFTSMLVVLLLRPRGLLARAGAR